MEENLISITDEDGHEIECEILFTFDSDAYNKHYVAYMPLGDEFVDEDGFPHIHVSAYEASENSEGGSLLPIEDDDEWDMVEEIVDAFLAEHADDDEGETPVS